MAKRGNEEQSPKAIPDLQPPSKRAKLGTADDESVTEYATNTLLDLGPAEEDKLLVDRRKLLETCAYFGQFDDKSLRGRFELRSVRDGFNRWMLKPESYSVPDAEHSQPVSQASEARSEVKGDGAIPDDADGDDEEKGLGRVSAAYRLAHRILFSMVSGESLDQLEFPEETPAASRVLLLLTNLSSAYGCIAHVKPQIISMLYTSPSLGRRAFNTFPVRTLEMSLRLKNKALLEDSFGHAVGHAYFHGRTYGSEDEQVLRMVSTGVSDLENTLVRAMKNIENRHFGKFDADMGDLVAEYIYRDYFRAEKLWPRNVKDAPQTFTTLKGFNELRSADDVIGKLGLEWVKACADTMDRGLTGANNIISQINWDRDEHDDSGLKDFEAAYEVNIGSSTVLNQVNALLADGQKFTKGLKVDWDLGYFDCARFTGELPWEGKT